MNLKNISIFSLLAGMVLFGVSVLADATLYKKQALVEDIMRIQKIDEIFEEVLSVGKEGLKDRMIADLADSLTYLPAEIKEHPKYDEFKQKIYKSAEIYAKDVSEGVATILPIKNYKERYAKFMSEEHLVKVRGFLLTEAGQMEVAAGQTITQIVMEETVAQRDAVLGRLSQKFNKSIMEEFKKMGKLAQVGENEEGSDEKD